MPTTNLKIASNIFAIEAPYVAGHVLSEIEAEVLNRTYVENIGNNVRAKLKASEDTSFEALNAIVQEKANGYEFSKREAAEPREKLSPVEREALNLIVEAIKRKLVSSGKNPKDYEAAAIKEKAKEILASEKGEPYMRDAKKIIAAREKAAADFEGLDF